MASSSASSGGIGFCGVFTIALFVLKVLGHIHCSWWWVFAPLWIPLGIGCAVGLAIILLWLTLKALGKW